MDEVGEIVCLASVQAVAAAASAVGSIQLHQMNIGHDHTPRFEPGINSSQQKIHL